MSKKLLFTVLDIVALVVVVGACGPTATPTSKVTPTAVPSAAPSTATPIALSTSVPAAVCTLEEGTGTIFTSQAWNYCIGYRTGWAVQVNETDTTHGSVTFTAQDGTALLLTSDWNVNQLGTEAIRDNYLAAFPAPNLKSSNKRLFVSGTASADIQFDNPVTKVPMHGIVRAVLGSKSAVYYILTFTTPSQFDHILEVGDNLLRSFHPAP